MAPRRGTRRRLEALLGHLTPLTLQPASALSPLAATNKPSHLAGIKLLTDDEMREFVARGFLVMDVHDELGDTNALIHERGKQLFDRWGGGGGVGNNIFPAIPQLGEMLDCPSVRGALTSLLGRSHTLNPHRFMHNSAMDGTQMFHKDSQMGKPAPHRSRSAFIFYYPAGCSREMGCTAVIPSSHLLSADRQNWSIIWESDQTAIGQRLEERPLTSAPRRGTAVIAHSGLIHRAMARTVDCTDDFPWRPMFKFIFERTAEPYEPEWDHDPEADLTPFSALTTEPDLVPAMESFWHWLLGRDESNAAVVADGDAAKTSAKISELVAALDSLREPDDEPHRMGIGYTLGNIQASAAADFTAAEALLAGLLGDSESTRRASAHGLAVAGETVVARLLQELLQRTGLGPLQPADASAEVVVPDGMQLAPSHDECARLIALIDAVTEAAVSVASGSTTARVLAAVAQVVDGAPPPSAQPEQSDLWGARVQTACHDAMYVLASRAVQTNDAGFCEVLAEGLLPRVGSRGDPGPGAKGAPVRAWHGLQMLCRSEWLRDAARNGSPLAREVVSQLWTAAETKTDRYTKARALSALRLLGEVDDASAAPRTESVRSAVLDKLMATRWCPLTTSTSQF